MFIMLALCCGESHALAQIAVETHMKDTALRGTPTAAAAAAAAHDDARACDAAPQLQPPSDAAAAPAPAPPPPPAAAAAAAAAARLPRKVNKKFSPAEHDSFSGPGGVAMTLQEVQQRIAADAEYVPQFWREKYEADAARNWDIFYSINSRNFFKVLDFASSFSPTPKPLNASSYSPSSPTPLNAVTTGPPLP